MFNRFKRKRSGFVSAPTVSRRRFLRAPHFSRTQITIGLLVVFFLLVGYMIFLSSLFKLRLVEFESNSISCVEKNQIVGLLPKNNNLLFVNVINLGESIRAKYPCLEFVSVRKKFPETLVISVSERKVSAFLKVGVRMPEVVIEAVEEASPSSASAKPVLPPRDDFKVNEAEYNQVFGVDKDGFLLTDKPDYKENIPIFYYLSEQPVEVNQTIGGGIIERAIVLSAKLWEMGIEVKSQKIIGTSLYIDGPQRIIFLLEKDSTEQVIPLQLILQKAKIDSTPIEKIDLRFDKPVVVYGKKSVTSR